MSPSPCIFYRPFPLPSFRPSLPSLSCACVSLPQVLMEPRILILDEATSALDNESESLVQVRASTGGEGVWERD